MHHFPELSKGTSTAETSESGGDSELKTIEVKMIDRSSQRWANVLGTFFSIASLSCLFALALLAIFFMTIVAENGEVGMIPIFIGLGGTFILGMIFLEFAHTRSLAGHRDARIKNAKRSRAALSVLVIVAFSMIHPLMGAAIPIAAGIGVLSHFLFSRLARREPLWDFLPEEAISILSGRDRIGVELAATQPKEHALASIVSVGSAALSILFALGAGGYLVATNVMTNAAVFPLVLGSYWATEALMSYVQDRFSLQEAKLLPVAKVQKGPPIDDNDEPVGLMVRDLNIRDPQNAPLLADVAFQAKPGTVTGILGNSGAGKSLLLQALADPFSISEMTIMGSVRMSGQDLWLRRASEQSVPAVLLPATPVILPTSGAENLSCFHDGELLTRGKWLLEQFVFATDMVESICNAPNAQLLPSMQQKSLSLARAFLLGPQLYLMDRPEDGLPEKQISALARRIGQETRMGRSVVMTTDKRPLLDICDRLIVLQDGRIIDYGEAKEVRARMENGWSRFLGIRKLDTEDNLHSWVRSHFYRDGDEANRRQVASIASDMLALSCQTANALEPEHVSFEFKHFEGHCIIRMQDGDAPISHAKMQLANSEADEETDSKQSLLANVIRAAMEVKADSKLDDRTLEVKIATYDPRKTRSLKVETGNAEAQS